MVLDVSFTTFVYIAIIILTIGLILNGNFFNLSKKSMLLVLLIVILIIGFQQFNSKDTFCTKCNDDNECSIGLKCIDGCCKSE